jgi:hypothetical protein
MNQRPAVHLVDTPASRSETSSAPELDIMTTFANTHTFRTSQGSGAPDFVSTDTAALASHMSDCAKTRSRFFGLHAALELGHALLTPRMVTAAVIAVVVLVSTGVV